MTENSTENGPVGVGGWLRLLVILLMGVGPVVTVAALGWAVLIQVKLIGLKPLALLGDALMLGLVYLSFTAGRDLKDLKPGAVKKAKLFFEAAMGMTVLTGVYMGNYAVFSGIGHVALLQVIEASVGFLIYSLAWHSYLSNSVRVRNTYR
ncbi:MAG: hypothetical protein A2049_03355 [Elusimicrobia bacterium GWA2_62_23]|nr:MAG: hypothetical protein A2049_03355 [Elusimicrobia bacterium GWA2_62_23]